MSGAVLGQLIGERYRLETELARGTQGVLWRASDQLAGNTPVVLRQLGGDQPQLQARVRELWPRLQGVLHPQVPRFGGLIEAEPELWLAREWQDGRTYAELLEARRQRQLVFGAGEVLLLLRQLLPVLAALHSQDLLHGDLTPANLLRRERDGLPVLLDFGLVRGTALAQVSGAAGHGAPIGVTPGYGSPELGRGDPAEPWMDLYGLGVVALVLLSGDEPAELLDPVTMEWRWPAALDGEPALKAALEPLLASDPSRRYPSAGAALQALQQLPMPDSTGPVPRADRTVVLVPQAPLPEPLPVAEVAAAAAPVPAPSEPAPPEQPRATTPSPLEAAPTPGATELSQVAGVAPAPAPLAPPPLRSRQEEREEAAEGRLWPVVLALVISAVLGTALGWLVLSRGRVATTEPGSGLQLPSSLPPAEVDQRQQLLNRLRALQIDRGWFLKLVDASLLAQFPERGGRLPNDSLDDAPLRKVWNELAQEWISRVEQLPLEIRTRLGSFTAGDWQKRQAALVGRGLSAEVLRQLVSGSAQNLLPGRSAGDIPPEPFRQLWYAAAEQGLANVRIEPIQTRLGQTNVVSAQVDAGGARLFPIRLSPGTRLVLGVNGSPLMQMSVFGADGSVLEARGPLRVVSIARVAGSPVQLLVTNDGVAPALITLSLRVDPAAPEATARPGEAALPPAGSTTQPADPAQPQGQPAPANPAAPAQPAPAAPATPATPSSPPPPVN
ncbi:phosphotransferase [Vulcanococcus limneticus Candia 3F8]|uniref:serine/threonine protein kinase n=1 Tax=Vulcanococcus limneticus TaxID=2170428 RepID=UPI000B981A2A|nr:phosphotransferase [Vulcanococcus limneticus]MCP9792890.1 phosphotransferase [Vulcanococcus limneticus MW73D5]MCP9894889.1 phosphotransferase [Vulcanococcus limneticus Candia 3F8]MCP9898334.1 phosphotransferase [Vulcanococcus limneticus Candia 3B3]